MRIKVLLFLLFVFLFFSCTFQKRLYRKGFYVEKHHILNNKVSQQKKKNGKSDIFLSTKFKSEKYLSGIETKNESTSHVLVSDAKEAKNFSQKSYFSNVVSKKHPNNEISQQKKHVPNNKMPIYEKSKFKPSSCRVINPTLKSQLISIIFYLYYSLWCVTYYVLAYTDPYLMYGNGNSGTLGIGFLLFIVSLLFIVQLISYLKDKRREFKASNIHFTKLGTLLYMLIYGFSLPIFIAFVSEAIYFGLENLPYPVPFFWFHIVTSFILLLIGIALLYLRFNKDKLMKESEIIEEPGVENDPKIKTLRIIRLIILITSYLLVCISSAFMLFITN